MLPGVQLTLRELRGRQQRSRPAERPRLQLCSVAARGRPSMGSVRRSAPRRGRWGGAPLPDVSGVVKHVLDVCGRQHVLEGPLEHGRVAGHCSVVLGELGLLVLRGRCGRCGSAACGARGGLGPASRPLCMELPAVAVEWQGPDACWLPCGGPAGAGVPQERTQLSACRDGALHTGSAQGHSSGAAGPVQPSLVARQLPGLERSQQHGP